MSIFGFGNKTINLEDEQFHNEFWSNFKEHLSNSESRLIPFDNKPRIYHSNDGKLYSYFGCPLGSKTSIKRERAPIWLATLINPQTDTNNVSVCLSIDCKTDQNHKTLFEKLKSNQSHIKTLFDDEFNCSQRRDIGYSGVYNTVDFSDRKNHEDIFNWMIDSLERVESVLSREIIFYYLNND